MQAAALQSSRQITGVVGRQNHVGRMLGREGAELGNRNLILTKQFEQHRFQGLVSTVDLVDQQHHRVLGSHGLQQGPWREEAVGEEDALLLADPVDGFVEIDCVRYDLTDLLAEYLGVQQLFAVIPLVERLRLVLPLVALQPEEPTTPVAAANALANSVLPTPAGPSISSGLSSLVCRKTVIARCSSAM